MIEIFVEVERLMVMGCHDEELVMEVEWDSALRFDWVEAVVED
jgi:hypothetical protein